MYIRAERHTLKRTRRLLCEARAMGPSLKLGAVGLPQTHLRATSHGPLQATPPSEQH